MRFPAQTKTDRWAWLLGAILLIAALLRIYALGRDALWCDEAYTAFTVRLPLIDMIMNQLRTDDAPPYFYLVVKTFTSIAGDSEAAVRTGSVLAGILAVALLACLAYRRRDEAYGWSAAFMATATYGVFHARQARSYMLVVLLALCVVVCARELLAGRRRAGPLLAVSGFMLCMTHHAAVVLLVASLLLWPLRRPRLRSWILWHALPLIVWAIYWTVARAQLDVHLELNAWTSAYWETHNFWIAPLYSLGVYLPGGLPAAQFGSGFAFAKQLGPAWSVCSVILALVCIGAAVLRARRETLRDAAYLLLPLLGLMAASLIVVPVYVVTRTDAVAYPAFVLLIGRGLAHLPRRLAVGIFHFWTLISLIALAQPQKGIDRQLAADMVTDGLARDDWVIHSFMTAPSIEYYLERLDAPHRIAYFPKIAGQNNASTWPTPLDSLEAYVAEARTLRATLEAALPEDGAVWIFTHAEPSAAEALRAGQGDGTLGVAQIGYPVSALIYTLVGTGSVKPVALYTQDWIGGHRALLRIPRADWAPLPPLEREEHAPEQERP